MAYTNLYAGGTLPTYSNPGYQFQPQIQQTQPTNQNPMMILISSEDEMRNYPVAAGVTVLLVSFNLGKFWLKSTDTNGVPQAVREFAFTEKTPVETKSAEISREEFLSLSEKVNKLLEELGGTNG